MNKRLVLALACFALGCARSALAALSIGPPTPVPASFSTGAATPVVVTSQFFPAPGDPAILPQGVNLLRVNASGDPTVLGVMHDDGMTGDTVAGDGIYTLVVTFNEQDEGTIQLQVSAPQRGVVQRVRSDVGSH